MQEAIDATAGNHATPGNHGAPTPDQPWIYALHHDLLGRPPEPDELARWTDDARRGASHRELAERFLRSDGYCSRQVRTLCRCLLDRDGDPAAVQAWTRSLAAGAPLQNVITGLCDSSEYRALHPSPATFVESLYERLLYRASDDAGRAAWLHALGARASTLSVIQGFVRSTEYCTQRLIELHVRLLGRAPDPPRLLRSVVAATQGTALQHFALEIVASAEYIARSARRAPAVPADPAGDAIPSAADLAIDPQGPMQRQSVMRRLMQYYGTATYRPCGEPARSH